jgi:hypothetical protein
MRSWLAMPPKNFSAQVGRPRTTPLLVSSAAMAYLRCCVSASGRRHVWRAVRDGEADRVEVERLARGELWRLRAHWRRVLRSIMGGYRVRAEVRMAVIQADGLKLGRRGAVYQADVSSTCTRGPCVPRLVEAFRECHSDSRNASDASSTAMFGTQSSTRPVCIHIVLHASKHPSTLNHGAFRMTGSSCRQSWDKSRRGGSPIVASPYVKMVKPPNDAL